MMNKIYENSEQRKIFPINEQRRTWKEVSRQKETLHKWYYNPQPPIIQILIAWNYFLFPPSSHTVNWKQPNIPFWVMAPTPIVSFAMAVLVPHPLLLTWDEQLYVISSWLIIVFLLSLLYQYILCTLSELF